MNILLIGSGGRENALAWKIAQSKKTTKLFVAPGNGGTEKFATNVDFDPNDHQTVRDFIYSNKIEMVVVGPEEPLCRGLHDAIIEIYTMTDIPIIGPKMRGAKLEGSKEFAKEFMVRHNIPTARYKSITKKTIADGEAFLDQLKPPYVLKADGLAAGKGVLILNDLNEAKSELRSMLNGKFGYASHTVVIEEYLSGIELSVFVLTDGNSYLILPEAKDYKRIGEGDTGLNTGGMGAVSPVPFADKAFMDKVEKRIVIPTIEGLKADNIDYQGFIFLGLMNCNGDPMVIEYNVRMGDPETEVVIPRIESDIVELFEAVGNRTLSEKTIKIKDEFCCGVVMVSGGYPGDYQKGKEIFGLDKPTESMIFHAGTKAKDGKILTSGGRVLVVSSFGKTMNEALEKSYKTLKEISYEGAYFRRDIGKDLEKYL